MASIDRICHMLLLTIFLICFSFLMQARRDRWETKVCDKPFHDGIISCMCVCCRSLLVLLLLVLLSFSFWPLCCLFFFDIRTLITLSCLQSLLTFWWDDNDVRFILDQQAELDFYSSSSLKQQSTGRHVSPLWHIILFPCQPVFAITP